MHATPTQNQPSISELLYALILALIPFVESLLANPAHAQKPSVRRLARTLQTMRALASLFGIRAPSTPTPNTPAPTRTHTHTQTPRRTPHPTLPAPQARQAQHRPGTSPDPTRTLEL